MKTICRKLHSSSVGFEYILHLGIFCARFYPICGVTSHLGNSPRNQTISGLPPGNEPYRDFPQEPKYLGTSPRKQTISGLPPTKKPSQNISSIFFHLM